MHVIDHELEGAGTTQLLRFRVGATQLAIPVRLVEEIAPLGARTVVPGVPRHIPGIIAVRGDAVPLLDLAIFVGLPPAEERNDDREARVLVVRGERHRVGLLCDSVMGVAVISTPRLEPPAAIQPPALREHATAQLDLGDGVAAVIDLDRLLEAARA